MSSLMVALTTSEILTLVSILLGGGFIAALVAVYKAKPERDSVVVSSAQNAATILQGLNDALYTELERARADRDLHERRAECYEAELRKAGITLPQVPQPPANA